ncbi:SdpI family protein [Sediminicola luteus]|uniref:SdpI/YhfL protein family n=1 Tax=Sediminicola luteus TaxID=319238 RepID=A0A2A4GFL7_9FLAO|nr:hypothetical protein B7P33_04565 [Sediminicola luteus]
MSISMVLLILLSILIMGLPLYFIQNPPEKPNSLIGYRSKTALANQYLWDKAQFIWPRVLLKFSLAVLVIQFGSILFLEAIHVLLLTAFLWVIALGLSVWVTEIKLKAFRKNPKG